jgi:hypothetical protein
MIVLQSRMTGAAVKPPANPDSVAGMSSPGGEEAGEGEPYTEIGRAVSPLTAVPSFLCAFAPLREIPSVLVPLCLGGEKTVCPSLPKIKPIKPKLGRFFKNHPNSTLDLGCLKSSSSSIGSGIRVYPCPSVVKKPLFCKTNPIVRRAMFRQSPDTEVAASKAGQGYSNLSKVIPGYPSIQFFPLQRRSPALRVEGGFRPVSPSVAQCRPLPPGIFFPIVGVYILQGCHAASSAPPLFLLET